MNAHPRAQIRFYMFSSKRRTNSLNAFDGGAATSLLVKPHATPSGVTASTSADAASRLKAAQSRNVRRRVDGSSSNNNNNNNSGVNNVDGTGAGRHRAAVKSARRRGDDVRGARGSGGGGGGVDDDDNGVYVDDDAMRDDGSATQSDGAMSSAVGGADASADDGAALRRAAMSTAGVGNDGNDGGSGGGVGGGVAQLRASSGAAFDLERVMARLDAPTRAALQQFVRACDIERAKLRVLGLKGARARVSSFGLVSV